MRYKQKRMGATLDSVYLQRKLKRLQVRCSEKGMTFDLTKTDLRRIYSRKTCYYSGVQLTWPEDHGQLRDTDVTLDRIDCTKGYVRGNVVACCHAVNALKGKLESDLIGLTPEQLIKALRAIADAEERIHFGK